MSTQVKAYQCLMDNRVINKRMISDPIILECRITEPFNVMDPEIFVEDVEGISGCNYFTIDRRKYFKSKITKVSNGMVRIKLHEDVLSTWMPYLSIKGKITNASQAASDYIDLDYLCEIPTKISRVAITNGYEEVLTDPAIIVQSPLPSEDNPNS